MQATDAAASAITPAALDGLAAPEGRRLLAETEGAIAAGEEEWRVQEILRRTYSPALCRAAVETVHLRRRAREKFPAADRMFFDRDGLEMASRWEIARYRASRFEGCDTVGDLCCGIGGDALALAEGRRVWAVDISRVRLQLARLNAEVLELGDRIGLAQCDARRLRPRADALFADPSRRAGGAASGVPRRTSHHFLPCSNCGQLFPALSSRSRPAFPRRTCPRAARWSSFLRDGNAERRSCISRRWLGAGGAPLCCQAATPWRSPGPQ